MAGTGTLEAGAGVNTLALANALPLAPAWLVFGLQAINASFKGDTLVPSPLLVLPTATSAAGGPGFSPTLPASVATGTRLFFQAWVKDLAAVQGFAPSNGLLGTTP